jgi:hypothetical protein
MTNCLNCNNEFKAKRLTAKYCSPKCRKLAFQEKGLSVPNLIKHLESKTVEELDKEGTWVPNWKKYGTFRAAQKTLIDIIEQFPSCKWMFKGYVIER